MAKKDLSSPTYKPYILPSEFKEMDNFISNNKIQLTEQVLASIEYALEKKLKLIDVFKFKNSDFVISLTQDIFKQNLENVYDYYIATEKYELCARVKKIEATLNNTVSYTINSHEKK
jgi:Tol biopolymer transport system component